MTTTTADEVAARRRTKAPRSPQGGGGERVHLIGGRYIDSGQGFGYVPADWANGRPGCIYSFARPKGDDDPELVPLTTWAPEVVGAYTVASAGGNPGEVRYRVRVGDVTSTIKSSELRDARKGWQQFPAAKGIGTRKVTEVVANLVIDLGASCVSEVAAPAWVGGRLVIPSDETIEAVQSGALGGYGRVAPGAATEHWRDICERLTADWEHVGRGALTAGVGLGGLFLSIMADESDLGDILDPVGFCVEGVGEGRQGKTTLQTVTAATVGSCARHPKGIVRAWRHSEIGIGQLAAQVGVMPLVFTDTSTARPNVRNRLGEVVMALLEGTGEVSSKDGDLITRGSAYESILSSSGNRGITSTLAGTAILARVLEIPIPITRSANDANMLKRAARKGYGWPLAQVLAGVITPDQMIAWQTEAAELLTADDHDPISRDVAVRCSVLVAGAQALGELVGLGEAMRDAALLGAREVIADVAGQMVDTHRPLAQELLAVAWESYARRPYAFPEPHELDPDRGEREGFFLSADSGEGVNDRLAVYPTSLVNIARGAGIEDHVPALRELRSNGYLVSRAGKLTGQFRRGGRRVQGVYVFELPPSDPPSIITYPVGEGATGATGPVTPSDQGSSPLTSDLGLLDIGKGVTPSDQGSSPLTEAVAPVAPSPTGYVNSEKNEGVENGNRGTTVTPSDQGSSPLTPVEWDALVRDLAAGGVVTAELSGRLTPEDWDRLGQVLDALEDTPTTDALQPPQRPAEPDVLAGAPDIATTPTAAEVARPGVNVEQATDRTPAMTWREWGYSHRATAYLDAYTGHGVTDAGESFKVGPTRKRKAGVTVAEMLAGLPESVGRVYLTGPRPGGGSPDQSRGWVLGALPDGWEPDPIGHYLGDPELPVGRYRKGTGKSARRVELHRMTVWGIGDDASPELARFTMAELDTGLRVGFGAGSGVAKLDGYASWLSTPATTGRELARSSVPFEKAAHRSHSYPTLSPGLADLVRSTSTQGRSELFDVGPELPALHYLDSRFAYAALLAELPIGPATLTDGGTFDPYAPARYEVAVTVPDDWDHVGLLGVPNDDGDGWHYPSGPGETFTTWADGAELHLAQQHGWTFAVAQTLHYASRGKPLDGWGRALLRSRDAIATHAAKGEVPAEVATLAQGAVRAILLHGIGAWHAQPRPVTRTGVDPGRAPAGAERHQLPNGQWTWTETTAVAMPELAHPEWSSTIWARCRARLLDSPAPGNTRAGALTLPRGQVVAFRTDALYLTTDPGWADDGKPGRYRLKGSIERPIPAPASMGELLSLRELAEIEGAR